MINVLLVDDEPPLLELTQFFLERDGRFKVDTATSSKSALGKMAEQQFDAIVADYAMPEMNGIELLKIIRNQGSDIPFIMFTGKGREDVAIEALNYGANFYLQKGGDPKSQFAELIHMIVGSVGQMSAEHQLHESDRRFREILQNVRHIAIQLDLDGRIVFCNDSLLSLTGWSLDEVMGQDWFELFIPAENREEVRGHFRELCERGDVLRAPKRENEIVTRMGERRLIDWDNTLLRGADHRVVGVASIGSDVTAIRKAQSQIEYQAQLLNCTLDAVISSDDKFVFTFWNRAAELMYGWKADEAIGRPGSEILRSEGVGFEKSEAIKILQEAGEFRGEFIQTRKDGSKLPVESRTVAVKDGDGRVTGYVSVNRDITCRKENEEKLLEITARLESIFRMSNDLFFELSSDGTVVSIRAANVGDLYRPPEEVVGRKFAEFLPREVAEASMENLTKVLRTKSMVSAEFSLPAPDGGRRHFEGRMFPSANDRVLAIVREITQDKRRQEELRKSEERFRMLAENSQDIVFRLRLGPNLGMEYISPSCTAITGYTPEEHYGDPSFGLKIVHPDDRPVLEAMTRPPISPTGATSLRWIRKDGTPIWMEIRHKVVTDKDGNPLAIEGVAREISERIRAEQLLEQSLNNTMVLIDSLPGYAFLKDPHGVYLMANQAFADAVRCPKDNIPGKTDYDMFPRRLAEKYRADDLRVMTSGEPLYVGEEEMVEGDRTISVVTRKVPVKDEKGAVVGLIGLGFDITERKHVEDELRLRLKYESLMNTISSDAMAAADVSEFLEDSLREIGIAADASRTYIFAYDMAQATLSNIHEWVSEGIEPRRATLQNMPLSMFPLWMDRLLRNEVISYEDVEKIPSEEDRERLRPQGIKAILIVPLYLTDGRLYGFLGIDECRRVRRWLPEDIDILRSISRIMMSVVERKGIERALKDSEERYRSVFENTGTATAILEEDGTISLVNSEFEKVSGYSKAEIMGKNALIMVDPADAAKVGESHRRRRTDPESVPRSYDLKILTKTGEARDIHISVAMIPGTKKSVASFRDVTQSRRAEKALADSERFLSSVFSSIQDGISVLDTDLRIIRVNPAMEKWYAHSMPLVGKKCFEAYHGRSRTCEVCPTLRTIQTGEAAHDVVPKAGPAGETLGWLDLFSFPLLDPVSGKLSGVIEYVRDASDRQRFEDALQQANAKLHLLGSVTRHDALNDLSVLAGWLEVAMEAPNNETVVGHLRKMKAASDSIRRQLEFTSEYEEMGVKGAEWIRVEDAFARASSGIPLEGIALDADLKGLTVYADPMLEKVFHNLLDNSVRHGQKVKNIRVSHSYEGDNARIVFEDDGIGIQEKDKKRIFEHGRGKHTGYGLYMVRSILGITGLTVEETGAEGNGARFEILIPCGKFVRTGK